MQNGSRECYRLNDLVLDVQAASLFRGDQAIEITGLTFDLLVYLVRSAPDVVSRDQILDEVWQDAAVGEETLKQRVRLLRRVLGDDSQSPSFIRTVRGKGYQWIAKTEFVREKPLDVAPKISRNHLKWALPLVLMLGVLIWWLAIPSNHRESISETSTTQDLYGRAVEYYHRYLPADNEKAIKLLNQTIASQPDHARAHALLSRAYSQQPKLGNDYWGEQALAAAERAIELAPDLADGYVSLGVYHDVSGHPSRGLAAYEQALSRDPEHGVALSNRAYVLFILGRLDEALINNIKGMAQRSGQFGMVQMGDILRHLGFVQKAEVWFQKANTLQPDNVFARTSYSKLLLLEGRYQAALDLLDDEATELWSGMHIHNARGDIYRFMGRLDEARQEYRASSPRNFYGNYGLALLGVDAGDARVGELEPYLNESVEKGYECADFPYYLAALALVRDDRQAAMSWLTRAVAAGWSDRAWLKADPAFESLRAEADFQALLQEIQTRVNRQRERVEGDNIIP